ncbi:hypothetical protein TWF730_000196 [Orbilia blumenaviensis]|uniref:C2H2-type domain-containing protein n=1 Tax=Orbilia blumenaviensis TaxID=1796055 RepID=A0AAV9VNL9_9PEZI
MDHSVDSNPDESFQALDRPNGFDGDVGGPLPSTTPTHSIDDTGFEAIDATSTYTEPGPIPGLAQSGSDISFDFDPPITTDQPPHVLGSNSSGGGYHGSLSNFQRNGGVGWYQLPNLPIGQPQHTWHGPQPIQQDATVALSQLNPSVDRNHRVERPLTPLDPGLPTTNQVFPLLVYEGPSPSGSGLRRGNIACPTGCGFIASSQRALAGHAKTEHGVRRPFPCEYCGKSITRLDNMPSHHKSCKAKGSQEQENASLNTMPPRKKRRGQATVEMAPVAITPHLGRASVTHPPHPNPPLSNLPPHPGALFGPSALVQPDPSLDHRFMAHPQAFTFNNAIESRPILPMRTIGNADVGQMQYQSSPFAMDYYTTPGPQSLTPNTGIQSVQSSPMSGVANHHLRDHFCSAYFNLVLKENSELKREVARLEEENVGLKAMMFQRYS